jgi:nucleoporin NDC1
MLVLWAWFPIGACGFRAVLLFLSSLVVFVLRVGQMHLGSRTTASPIGTFKYLVPLNVLQTFGWYLFSAWWLSEIYKWSCPTSAQLEWVKRGRYVSESKWILQDYSNLERNQAA